MNLSSKLITMALSAYDTSDWDTYYDVLAGVTPHVRWEIIRLVKLRPARTPVLDILGIGA